MKKHDELWHNINNLLSFLRGRTGNEVVDLVNEFYLPYNNDAPGKLIEWEMAKLQDKLDKAED